MQDPPHTAHGLVPAGRSGSTDFFAISNISGEMIGSDMGFRFILVFTIEQIGSMPNTTSPTLVRADCCSSSAAEDSDYLTCFKHARLPKSAKLTPYRLVRYG